MSKIYSRVRTNILTFTAEPGSEAWVDGWIFELVEDALVVRNYQVKAEEIPQLAAVIIPKLLKEGIRSTPRTVQAVIKGRIKERRAEESLDSLKAKHPAFVQAVAEQFEVELYATLAAATKKGKTLTRDDVDNARVEYA